MRLAAAMLHQRPMTLIPCHLTTCRISTSCRILRLYTTVCATFHIGSPFELSYLRLSTLITYIVIGRQPRYFRCLVIIVDFVRVGTTRKHKVMSTMLCRTVHARYLSAVIVFTHDLIDLFTLHYGIDDEAVSGFVLT